MKLGLQLRLKQTLAPQLIQSLKMLQMPILKLEQTLRHELATNPLLEESEELEDELEKEVEFDVTKDETNDSADKEEEKIDWDDYLRHDDYEYKIKEHKDSREDTFLATTSGEKSLYDHLLEQLSLLRLSQDEHEIGEYVLGNVDNNGYLVVSVAEMAEELDVAEEKIAALLSQIKKFDPLGVGSRDLRESLLTQLVEKKMENTLAHRIISEHLYDLEKKSILQIAKLMGVPFDKAQNALDVIKTLSPTPAYGRFDLPAASILPDLIIERVDDGFAIIHNDRSVPRLRINPSYRSLVKRGSSSTKDTKKYISQKLEQARWLLSAINQRRQTMVRVMEAIIEEQIDFFERGIDFLKPLIMEDIAQKVDMNVATISRVSNSKYVQTPHGVFEIKFFFNTGISRSDGGELSKRSVKQRIEVIIKSENIEKPFSDQEIFRKLQEDGIKLARRTVTKYREELKILPARFRRRSV
ncbi:MAG: RNA polymerase factor sigma-54 [candidate division Zixibacteria bacterium]|nr:RNA polymerase factor sigma-54 [candidate division Zixibacteria bacterium]